MATTISTIEKTVMCIPCKVYDPNALFGICITNFDTAREDLGSRPYQDDKHLSIFEILGELEDNARIAYFQEQAFDQLEGIYYGDGHYAVFSFKELRKTENGAIEACYEYEYLTCDIEEVFF